MFDTVSVASIKKIVQTVGSSRPNVTRKIALGKFGTPVVVDGNRIVGVVAEEFNQYLSRVYFDCKKEVGDE